MNLDKETVYIIAALAVALIVFISLPFSSWVNQRQEEGPQTRPNNIEFCRSVTAEVRNQPNKTVSNFTCYPGNEKYAEKLDVPAEVRDLSDLRCLCTFIDGNGSRKLLPIWQSRDVSGAEIK